MGRDARTAVIMVVLSVEYSAVRAFLHDLVERVHPSGTVYEQGFFESNGAKWRVVLGQTGMGNSIAAIETARALDAFQPDLAVFVGVAGGLNSLDVGDVVAADYVYGYESGRYAETLQSRIKTFGSGYPWVQRAHAVRRQDHWHKRISSGAQPRAFVGPIASSERIIAGKQTPAHELLERTAATRTPLRWRAGASYSQLTQMAMFRQLSSVAYLT
jgi:nucleoside phosphorylase